jgi:hypothetical protein
VAPRPGWSCILWSLRPADGHLIGHAAQRAMFDRRYFRPGRVWRRGRPALWNRFRVAKWAFFGRC